MANWAKHIIRFSSFMKVLTILGLLALILSYLSPFVHPNTFKILPFFGLAYPIIILGVLLALVYWLFKWSRWALVILIVVVLGGKLHFRSLSVTISEEVAPPDSNLWRIMSYNVRLFDVYNESLDGKLETRNKIMDLVSKQAPDVICFQEFYHQDKPTKFTTRDSLIQLLQIRDYHERYSHKIRERQNFGICMMSKYPMIAKGDVMFENFEHSDNYCIYADIVKGNDTIRVYNIHLQSIKLQQKDYELFGQEDQQAGSKPSTFKLLLDKLRVAYPARAEQALRVVEHIQTSPYPVVVCGDFNDTPMSYVYQQFNRYLIDSFRETSSGIGKTYAGKVPAGRIDYIFHSPHLKAQNFQIQQQVLSDHLGIICELWKPATN